MSRIKPIEMPNDHWEALKAALASPAVIVATIGPPTLLRAAVVSILWNAFLLPAGAPALRLGTAFGLVLIIEAVGVRHRHLQEKTLWAIYLDRAMEAFIVLLLGLIGWIFI